MATVTLVRIFKDLSNSPKTHTRQMEYVIKRIEREIEQRAKRAMRRLGL